MGGQRGDPTRRPATGGASPPRDGRGAGEAFPPRASRGVAARDRRHAITLLVALALAGCGMMPGAGDGPAGDFRSVPAQARETTVDPAEAARKINAFRRSRGRAPLTVDPRLNAVAAATARELARRDRLKTELHSRGGLQRRLDAAGYAHVAAAENLGAGYPTLELAVRGWRNSPGHRRNLLNRNVDHMGIGLALADGGRYVSYWVLIMARPADAPAPAL